jgi:hypothetical protein
MNDRPLHLRPSTWWLLVAILTLVGIVCVAQGARVSRDPQLPFKPTQFRSGTIADMDARSGPDFNDPFDEAIDDALSSLPANLRAAMSNVEIVVEDEPPDGQPLLGLCGVGGQLLEGGARVAPVHVAQRDDVLARQVDQIRPSHAPDANTGDVEPVAGCQLAAAGQDVARHDGEAGRGCSGGLEKLASRNFRIVLVAHGRSFP